ncbi:MAG: hypothetical protein EPO24_05045 [Bacteroidetes bacterium]|nr:MAG: hypothetical protein EPO24_05045 [Bacteroidota bacterium]
MSNIPPEENSDEVWDEFKWEQFMQEQDRKVDRIMELMERYKDDPNCDDIVAREMGWDKAFEEMEGEDSDIDEPFYLDDSEEDDDDDDNAGEEWKSVAGAELQDGARVSRPYHSLPAFQRAHEFGLRSHKFVMQMQEQMREDSDVVDFVSNAMIAAAKMAGGASFHDDARMLGGNIAYCKRGLNAANKSIEALQTLRNRKMIDEESYVSLFKDAKEVRDGIALYIVDLREKFRSFNAK